MADVDVAVDPLIAPQEQDTKTVTSTSGGRVMSKPAGQAIKDEYAANVDVAKARAAQGEQEALLKAREADQLAEASDLAHAQSSDAAAEHQAYADRIQAARDASAVAEEAFANHKFEDYWSHQGVGKRIAAAFPLFLGGIGAAYLGQQNPGAEALNRAIDRDFQKQKMGFDQMREVARMKGADVNELFVQEGHENAALAIKQAKAKEATAASMVQAMTEAGIPLERAKTAVAVTSLLAGAEKDRREALQHYDRTFQGSTTKKEVTGTAGAGSVAEQRLALQKQKLIVRDTAGNPLGSAHSPEEASKLADQQAKLGMYQDAVERLAAHIDTKGHLYNPLSDDYKERESLVANAQALGRGIKGIQASDAGQKLEHMVIGGSGTGISRSADTKVLRGLAGEATAQVERHLKASLMPLPGEAQSRGPAPLGGEAPAATPAQPAPAKTPRPAPQGVSTADLAQMRKAHKKGDTRFDDILRANGVI